MTVQIVTKEDLQELKSSLIEEIREIFINNIEKPSGWLKSSQVMEMLSISPATLQTWRINGIIPYTKVGRIFYYKNEDIQNLFSPKVK